MAGDDSPMRACRKRRPSFDSLDGSYEEEGGSDYSPESEVSFTRSPTRSRGRASTSASSVSARWDEVPKFPARPDAELESALMACLNNPELKGENQKKMTFAHDFLSLGYMWYPGRGVSRTALFSAYNQACQKYNVSAINSACFGKTLRNLYRVESRRIGGRKLSRYHYMHIWPATVGELTVLKHYDGIERAEREGLSPGASLSAGSLADAEHEEAIVEEDGEHELEQPIFATETAPPPQLPAPASSRLPGFPDVPEALYFDELALSVWHAFEQHSIALLDVSQAFRYDLFGTFVRQFYELQAADQLTQRVLEHPAFIDGCLRGTSLVYSNIWVWLARQIHMVVSDQGLSALDDLASSLPQLVADALKPFHQALSTGLMTLATQFAHLLGRQCAVLRMAPAIRAMLMDVNKCDELEQGWIKINFQRIAEHVAASSDLPLDHVDSLLSSWARLLKQLPASKDVFGLMLTWLDHVHNSVAACQTTEVASKAAFVISLLMRDITLRGDPSLPSYALLGCFTQEYLGLRVLHAALPASGSKSSEDASATDKSQDQAIQSLSEPMMPSQAILSKAPSPVTESHTPAESPLLSAHSFCGSAMLSSTISPVESEITTCMPPATDPLISMAAYINLSPTQTVFGDALRSPINFGGFNHASNFGQLAQDTFVPHDSYDAVFGSLSQGP